MQFNRTSDNLSTKKEQLRPVLKECIETREEEVESSRKEDKENVLPI